MRLTVFVPLSMAKNLNRHDGSLATHSTPSQELHAAFTAVAEEVKRTGRITPTVYQTIIGLRNMVSDFIEPAITDAHFNDQTFVNALHLKITEADAAMVREKNDAIVDFAEIKSARTTWKTNWNAAEDAKEVYAKCTEARKKAIGDQVSPCCATEDQCTSTAEGRQCVHYKLGEGYVKCDFEKETAKSCYLRAFGMVSPYKESLVTAVSQYQEHHRKCLAATTRAEAEIKKCDSNFTTAEAAVKLTNQNGWSLRQTMAAFHTEVTTTCDTSSEKRARLVQEYHDAVGPCSRGAYGDYSDHSEQNMYDVTNTSHCVQLREKDRLVEWEATQQILCALTHLSEGGTFDDDLVEKCKDEIKVCHLHIKYPEIPDPTPCPDPICDEVPTQPMIKEGSWRPFNHTECKSIPGCVSSKEIMCVHEDDEINGCNQWHADKCTEHTPAPQDDCEVITYERRDAADLTCTGV